MEWYYWIIIGLGLILLLKIVLTAMYQSDDTGEQNFFNKLKEMGDNCCLGRLFK